MVDENAPTDRDGPSTADDTPEKRGLDPGLVLERYQLGAVLGRGGMGEVIAATDLHIERDVAIKRVRSSSPTADDLRRFEREARIQARLDHPAIVPVHELGKDAAGRPYFTMKRLAGTTLLARMRAGGGPIQPLLRALVDSCFALAHAHDRNIVHRDIKPANIMLGDYGEVYVLDWGVARVLGAERASALSLVSDSLPGHTTAGTILGTPGYMAPEQTRGDAVGPSADVYALGAILFEILAGEPLHPTGTAALASTLEHPTDSPARRARDRDVPVELDKLSVAALAEDAAARPTARALAEGVQAYLDGDRDLERRRLQAADKLLAAREALDSGDPAKRRFAMQSASGALALDPSSVEAQRLVTQLMLTPPDKAPPEARAQLAERERELDRGASRAGIYAYLSLLLLIPFLPALHVASWPLAIGVVACSTGLAGLAAINANTGKVPMAATLVANTALAAMFALVASPFVLTPMVMCAQLVAVTSQSRFAGRTLVAVCWAVATLLVPIALPYLGWFPETWRVGDEGLVTWSAIVGSGGTRSLVAIVVGQCALAAVVAFFVARLVRMRRDAQRTAFLQAWHLKQMLPRGSSQIP